MLFAGAAGGRRPAAGLALAAALMAALPAMVKSLALEVAPVRVNLIAAGFADTPELASLPVDQIDERRMQPHAVLPADRVIASADTGATIDILGGQQLLTRDTRHAL